MSAPQRPVTPAQPARPSDDPGTVTRTQRIDIARSVPLGVIFPLEASVLLTIAILHFDAPGIAKGFIAAASGIGMLTSTFVTAGARRQPIPAMRIASAVVGIGALGFLLAATGSLLLFVIGSIIGLASTKINLPLVTATYERNFPTAERGRRVGRGLTIKVGVSSVVALGIGAWFERRPQDWWLIVLLGAAATGALAALNARMPSEPLEPTPRRSPLPHFELLREDHRFALILGAWMLMGFGNLMLLPLRVEYLAQPEYSIEASAALITALTVAVPSLIRLGAIPVFGQLFDRMPFFTVRIAINLLFAVSSVVFFATSSTVGLWLGAMLLGLAFAGGELMWMLWVTKFAPPDRVADYMGLHMFFTGVRAVGAPLVGYLVIERFALGWVAAFGVSLMLLSSLILARRAVGEWRTT